MGDSALPIADRDGTIWTLKNGGLILASAIATGVAGCSVDLGYLDASGGDGSVTGGNVADRTSSDDHAVVADATNTAETGGQDVANPADAGPIPALLPDAATYTCPTTIYDALSTSDGTQIGRFNRIVPASVCGTTKTNPMTTVDPTGLHQYVAYRFANNSSTESCYTFTLLSGTIEAMPTGSAPDASDASLQNDVSTPEDGSLQNDAAGPNDAGTPAAGAPAMFMFAFATFYPTNLNAPGYLGDVGQTGYLEDGGTPATPYTMAITVPGNSTIDVVVMDVDLPGSGYGTFTLSCTAQ